MRSAAFTAALVGGGLMLTTAAARADCAWDIRMTASDIAEVEGTLPLAANPGLPLGPGLELPPQRRSTGDGEGAPGVGEGELVSGATPAGQEVVPDATSMTGQMVEVDSASGTAPAAGHLASAKAMLRDAQNAANAGDETACFDKIDQAKDALSQARAAVITAAGGTLPPPSGLPALAERSAGGALSQPADGSDGEPGMTEGEDTRPASPDEAASDTSTTTAESAGDSEPPAEATAPAQN